MRIMFISWLMFALAALLLLAVQPCSAAGDSLPRVEFNTRGASPRPVESLTERSIVRDYSYAWKSLADAFEHNSPELLDGYFVGKAGDALSAAVTGQKTSGIRSRCLNQDHKVEVVFYSPEGDVMELHDTAQCDLQLVDGGKVVHDEHVVLHYVVLMTPAADRWVVRQLQAVPQF